MYAIFLYSAIWFEELLFMHDHLGQICVLLSGIVVG